MVSKKTSHQSQAHFDPYSVEHRERIMDFLIDVEDWESEERNIVSETLNNDEEYTRKLAEIEVFRILVIEHIVENLDKTYADLLLTYMRMVEEQYETTICMADMIAYDARVVKGTKEK